MPIVYFSTAFLMSAFSAGPGWWIFFGAMCVWSVFAWNRRRIAIRRKESYA